MTDDLRVVLSLLKRGQVLRKRECGKVDNGKNRGATQRASENTVKQGSNADGVNKHRENKGRTEVTAFQRCRLNASIQRFRHWPNAPGVGKSVSSTDSFAQAPTHTRKNG